MEFLAGLLEEVFERVVGHGLSFVLEQGTEAGVGAGELFGDGAEGAAGDLGDFGDGEFVEMTQRGDEAFLFGEASEERVEIKGGGLGEGLDGIGGHGGEFPGLGDAAAAVPE